MKKREYNVRLYSATSEGLQRRTGVDPARCFKMIEVRTRRDRRPDLGTFLLCVARREWATTRKGEPNQHDSLVHKYYIRTAHPVVVEVLAFIASKGAECLPLDKDTAEEHALIIDRMLSYDGFQKLSTSSNVFIFDSRVADNTWIEFCRFAKQMYASQGSDYFNGVTDDFLEAVRSIQTAHGDAIADAAYLEWRPELDAIV